VRALLILALGVIPAAAQSPLVRTVNLTRRVSGDFQTGERFEILITGAPNQPVSVRTTRQGRTDWDPIIGSTDSTGRWSTAGRFEKSDFGDWSEVWTVGGKLATPSLRFSVNAPCLPGGQGFVSMSGINMVLTCETAQGRQTFATPSGSDSFRTPDGRLVPVRAAEQTPEQYHMEILQYLIENGKDTGAARVSLQSFRGGLGDETAELIASLIGVNALDEKETRNVLEIVRAAFEKPETIAPSAKDPARTLLLLRHLADVSGQDSLKRQIGETIASIQAPVTGDTTVPIR
jgi:hypothetical protein